MFIKKIVLITTLISSIFITAFSNNALAASLKVGVIAGPEEEIAKVAQKQAKELYNLDVELVTFNDYVIPNQALNDKLIDLNAFQHKPFLDQQMQERGYHLTVVGNTFIFPIAAYSLSLKPISPETKIDTQKGVIAKSPRGDSYFIPNEATIAIPNDPTNLGRALLLLQHEGFIEVDASKGLLPTTLDITSNPHKFNIIELEAPMLPHALEDSYVDLAVINNAFAGVLGLSPQKNGLFMEDKKSPYINIIVAREDNKDEESVKNFVKAFQTEPVEQKAAELYTSVVRGW